MVEHLPSKLKVLTKFKLWYSQKKKKKKELSNKIRSTKFQFKKELEIRSFSPSTLQRKLSDLKLGGK
jgi:hypothetical protein